MRLPSPLVHAQVKASGEVVLTSGGYLTLTTMMSMNDALGDVGIKVLHRPHTSVPACAHARVRVCMCVCLCMRAHTSVCMCVGMCMCCM